MITLPALGLLMLGLFGTLVLAQEESSAKPTELPDLKPSKDWRALEIAVPKGMQMRAWSDAAAGCHLALFSIPIPDRAAEDKIVESLSATLAKSDYHLAKLEGDQRPTRFELEGFGVTGLASLHLPEGQGRTATMLACYGNDREPQHCRAMCEAATQRLIDTMPTSKQSQP